MFNVQAGVAVRLGHGIHRTISPELDTQKALPFSHSERRICPAARGASPLRLRENRNARYRRARTPERSGNRRRQQRRGPRIPRRARRDRDAERPARGHGHRTGRHLRAERPSFCAVRPRRRRLWPFARHASEKRRMVRRRLPAGCPACPDRKPGARHRFAQGEHEEGRHAFEAPYGVCLAGAAGFRLPWRCFFRHRCSAPSRSP